MEDATKNDGPRDTEEANYIEQDSNKLDNKNVGVPDTESEVGAPQKEPTIDGGVVVGNIPSGRVGTGQSIYGTTRLATAPEDNQEEA